MKTGLSLTALAQEIERRSAAKQDFIAPKHCDAHHAEWAERHAAARESADITERAALIDAGRGHLVRP